MDDQRDYAEEAFNERLMREEPSDHGHVWVSGMMYVHPEDVHAIAIERKAAGATLPECEVCEMVYDPSLVRPDP